MAAITLPIKQHNLALHCIFQQPEGQEIVAMGLGIVNDEIVL